MGKKYDSITDDHRSFIEAQKIYFCATAAAEGRVNLSPKGSDTLRVVSPTKVIWLNLTGSGNETAAHLLDAPRMTRMFCAYEGSPKILRLYGSATAVYPQDERWENLYENFESRIGARQIYELDVDLVQTSCGFGIPYYDYAGDRDKLREWESNHGENGIEEYWHTRNATSLDARPTRTERNN